MVYFEKSQPAPDCLAIEKSKKSGTYRCENVYERLQIDFKNKCYLCEQKAPTSINIEHFVPHRGNQDLMFEWENLFFSCNHCNMTKLANAENDFLLDCTKEHRVDQIVEHHFEAFPKERVWFITASETNINSNTSSLLQSIFDGSSTLKKLESANLRALLRKEIVKFGWLLEKFNEEGLHSDEKDKLERKIIKHLQNDSAFTAFKRQIIRENPKLNQVFVSAF